MENNAFQQFGPTVLVTSVAPAQALTTNNTNSTSYRIRNLNASAEYFCWAVPLKSGLPPTGMNPSAPTTSASAPNTIGMLASSVETFSLPTNAWFIARAGTFEVTPGEGL